MNNLKESKVLQFSVFGATSAIVLTVPTSLASFFLMSDLALGMALAATLLSILAVIENVFKLSSGFIIQKINMKWGKYRSWIVILRWVIVGGSVVLFINTSVMPGWVRILVFSVGYFALYIPLVFTKTAHYMLITKIAGVSMRDRLRLSIRNSQFSMILVYAITYLGLPISELLSPLNANTQSMIAPHYFYVALFLLGAFMLTSVSKLYDISYSKTQLEKLPKVTLGDSLRSVFANRSLLSYMIADVFSYIGIGASHALMAYYFIAVMDRPELLGLSLTVSTVAGFIAILILPNIGIKIGKKKAMVIALLGYGFLMVGIFFFATSSVIACIALFAFGSAILYLFRGFGIMYLLDSGEYHYWKTGKDNRAVAVSLFGFSSKIGIAIGTSLISFVPNTLIGGAYLETAVTASTIRSFMVLFSAFPAVCAFIGALIMHFGYQISDKDAEKYIKENAERTGALLKSAE